jgi:GPH family glycoside/pentoside/hexuronide:cation symporter
MKAALTLRDKWIYGSGDLGFSLTNTIRNVYLALFLTDVVGVAPKVAALAFFVGSTWDYLNDPIVGYISDRTRTRWGRRRPFLLVGALPFAAAFCLLVAAALEGTRPSVSTTQRPSPSLIPRQLSSTCPTTP